MNDYTEPLFEKKLADLRDSQKEIQNLSTWLVQHRKNARSIVKIWYNNIKLVHKNRKLTFMYLANDVVQNSKRKSPDLIKEFSQIMVKTFKSLAGVEFEDKTVMSLIRLTGIWQERQIFDKKILQEIGKIWEAKKGGKKSGGKPSASASTPAKISSDKRSSEERRKSSDIVDIDEMLESPLRKLEPSPSKRQVFQVLEETITLSPRMGSPGSGDPPEPDELIAALETLENSASSDAEVREKIAKLPTELSEVRKIEDIQSVAEGEQLLTQVDEASILLNDYNSRLQDELKERRKVGTMVSEFLSAQKELLAQAEERLEIYLEKLEKIQGLKDELKSHIAALPDIPMLPSGPSLAPLPPPGDLFTH